MRDPTELRLALLRRGYEPLPATGKAVYLRGWPSIEINETAIRSWATDARQRHATNTSIRLGADPIDKTGHLVALDFDLDDPAEAAWFRDAFADRLPGALWRVSPSGRSLALFRARSGVRDFPRIAYRTTGGGAVEWLRRGQQVVAYGEHPSGGQYEWPFGGPLDVPRDDLPVFSTPKLRSVLTDVEAAADARGLLREDAPSSIQPQPPVRYTLTGNEYFDLENGERASYNDVLERLCGSDADYLRCSDSCLGGNGRNRRKCVVHLDPQKQEELMVYNFETATTHRHQKYDTGEVLEKVRRATIAIATVAPSTEKGEEK